MEHHLDFEPIRNLKYLVNTARPETLNYVNFLAMIGLVGTCMGFYYTFRQLKLMEERIDSYTKFYEALETFQQEITSKKAKEFYFYGSTVLPGNIAFRHKEAIDNFTDLIKAIYINHSGYNHLEERVLIVPNTEQMKKIYSWYYENYVKGHAVKNDKEQWKEFVDRMAGEAEELITTAAELSSKNGTGTVYRADQRAINDIRHAYYLSNGKRVIFAVPLHYVDSVTHTQDGQQGNNKVKNTTVPQLAGFSTTNSRVVEGFKARLHNIIDNIDQDNPQ